jgi:hypothetical protein
VRALTFAAIVLVAALCVYDTYVASALPNAGWGFRGTPASSDLRIERVATVVPNSVAARARIVPGDVLRVRVPHAFSVNWPIPGQRVTFEVTHGSEKRSVTLTAQKFFVPRYATENILFAAEIIALLLAALLAWRRWSDPVARPLMLYLLLQATTLSVGNLPGYTYAYIRSVQTILIFLSYAALIRFTAIYPSEDRLSRLRRGFALWAPAVTLALGVILAIDQFAVDWLNRAVQATVEYRYASVLCADAVPLLGLVLGALSSPPSDRRRLVFLIAFFIAGISGPLAYNVVLATSAVSVAAARPLLSTLIVMNAGFVYMILRQRMFDIGFVLNRAAVYAVLTTVFVPLFALLEWLAERYLSSQNRAESALLQVGIALVLFISIRLVHASAEKVVDQWLFRERHENETALRDFARHVLFVTDEQTITERTVQNVCSRTEASWSAVYLMQGAGNYRLTSRCGDVSPPVMLSENDAAVVAMRADRASAEHVTDSAFHEALILPLFARAVLSGFIVCGPKPSGESYAPDERDALAQIAYGVAVALDGVRLTQLEEKIARLEGAARLQPQI